MRRFVLGLCAALAFAGAAAAQTAMTYQAFTARAQTLHPGATHDEIVAALGAPTEEDAGLMEYDLSGLKGFPGIPGPVGTQTFVEAHITMSNGRMTAIDWASIDSTGTGKPPG
jgi:hypothetical protein